MTASASRPPPIADYALIGDCRSAALISRDGSLDWLCWPRFESPSLFAALLDPDRGGRFAIRPVAPFTTTRAYVPETQVLETTFRTEAGVARLTDLMPVASEEEKRRLLWPEHQILRRIECLEGQVEIEVLCEPRPDYGRRIPRLRDRGKLGLYYESRGDVLVMRSDIPLRISTDGTSADGRALLRAGERGHVSLVFTEGEPAVIPPLGAEAQRKIDATVRWWRDWSSRCRYEGPYRDAVVRSALTLKAMAYAPSGAVIAAPTTSLPEKIGGVRNWDYRYCWLRDASLTLQVLYDLGYPMEADAFLGWLMHSTRLTWPELQILYDVHGETRLGEQELHHLAGYAGSRPVRIGNDAHDQLQLDVYGELIDAVYQFVQRGRRLDRGTGRMLVGLGRTVVRRWREPDEGIWEIRGGRLHHTFSKAMCWVALDRLLRLHDQGHLDASGQPFARERDAIREEVERRGFNSEIDSYVTVFEGTDVDASLLLLPRYGYVEPHATRMAGTWARIHARLGKNGLLYRYLAETDGLPPGEGAFGISSFWAVNCGLSVGDVPAAVRHFERMLSLGNDVGLFAEEIDPDTHEQLGNFPQAFTHVGLIDAALALEKGAPR